MIVQLTMGSRPTEEVAADERVQPVDLYRLASLDLSRVRGLLVGVHCDQLFLEAHRSLLDRFLDRGGRLVVCGQIERPFTRTLVRSTPLRDYTLDDLRVRRLANHAVWDGVDVEDLTFRRGVAGFYGRVHCAPPLSATVVHGLGADARPLDYVVGQGQGKLLFHGGNALWGYAADASSAARMAPQLLDWIAQP